MNKGAEVARGKTKILYERPGQPDALIVASTDNITAGDGARRNEIAGKGRLAARTTVAVFRLLNLCGLPTHYLSGGTADDDGEMVVRRCAMIPLEVVVRGVAAGSLVKRKPGVARGSIIAPRLIEFFYKDDANHDPLIEPDEIVHREIATPAEIGAMSEIARIAFEILAHAWRRYDTLLVDLKIEFGRPVGSDGRPALAIADVIDNDSWRIWPQGREELMLDKQMYRNLKDVTPADLERVRDAYERVAATAEAFAVARPATVALIADGPPSAARFDAYASALRQFGFGDPLRHIASPTVVPGFVTQLVQQLDATFVRLVYGAFENGPAFLGPMLGAATAAPVFDAAQLDPAAFAFACAKAFALDDTVMFGRTLLVQANARTAVLQANAELAVPPAANWVVA